MISPNIGGAISHQSSSLLNLMDIVQSEPLFFKTKDQMNSYSQHKTDKPSIIVASEVNNQSLGAIFDLKQSAKSISDTLVYIFSQFVDHITESSNGVDFEYIKTQWSTLKYYLQPFNQQKVTEFFKTCKNNSTQSSLSSYRDISQAPSFHNYHMNTTNHNDTSIDPIAQPKSIPTSTRNNQSAGHNCFNLNAQEIPKIDSSDSSRAFNTVQNVSSCASNNMFLNACSSPSAPTLLPQSSSAYSSSLTPPPITQKNDQSAQSSNLLTQQQQQLLQLNQIREDMTPPLYTMTSVSRCNSFTTSGYPQVSNFEINTTNNTSILPNQSTFNINNNNNNTSLGSNQFINLSKKDTTPTQSSTQQNQGLSMTSRNKKEANWSQYKAVPISTFKLEVPRLNKHMHQQSQNNNQVTSQTNLPSTDQEQVQSSSQQSGVNRREHVRGNSQSHSRYQSPTNVQQHHNFLQQQRESLARQTSASQERSIVSKLIVENKEQPLSQQNKEQFQSLENQTLGSQGSQQFLRSQNNQQISPRQSKKDYNQQPSLQSFSSNTNLGSNFNSINGVQNQNITSQHNQGISSVNSSTNLSYKTFNQILQSQPYNSQQSLQTQKPLQGITLLSNNSMNQQSSLSAIKQQPLQLQNQKSQEVMSPLKLNTNIFNVSQAKQLTEETCKENDRYAYYFTRDSEKMKDQSENKAFFDNKISQSAGKQICRQSQNKIINLNSYQVPSQYGSKQNNENCLSPQKFQSQQQSKSFHTKNILQSPTTISIQSINSRLQTETNGGKTFRLKTETEAKGKGNTTEQLLLSSQNAPELIFDASILGGIQSQRSYSKISTNSQMSITSATQIPLQQTQNSSTVFQTNFLKSKISNLLSLYEENNIIINSFKLK